MVVAAGGELGGVCLMGTESGKTKKFWRWQGWPRSYGNYPLPLLYTWRGQNWQISCMFRHSHRPNTLLAPSAQSEETLAVRKPKSLRVCMGLEVLSFWVECDWFQPDVTQLYWRVRTWLLGCKGGEKKKENLNSCWISTWSFHEAGRMWPLWRGAGELQQLLGHSASPSPGGRSPF